MTSDELKKLLSLAERNFGESQMELAQKYATGDGLEQNLGIALYWYERASAQGFAEATYHLGLMYLLGEGTAKQLDLALELFNDAANQGSDDAHFLLGDAYAVGSLGLPEDGLRAARHYLEACAWGGAFRGIPSLGKLIAENKIDVNALAKVMCDFGNQRGMD